jgi:hypothetical protein
MSTYNPVVPAETARPELEPLIPSATLDQTEAQDAAFAARLNDEELNIQRQEEIEATSRAWDSQYRWIEVTTRTLCDIMKIN